MIRGARAANRSDLDIPARRDFFLLYSRLSPQAKDLCGKLSNNDNITLSPAYGGRKKRTEKRTVQRQDPQKQIGRTYRGKQPVFPSGEKLKQEADANTLFRETRHSAVCVSQRSRTKERGLWFTPNEIFVPTKRKFFF